MTAKTHNIDNMLYEPDKNFDIIFADFVYENDDFSWVDKFWNYLKPNGLFVSMTDFHTSPDYGYYLKHVIKANRVCKYVWKNEWGNHPKNRPHECYDEIFVHSNGDKWNFDSNKIQVPKATAKTNLNPSGRETKTATAWIEDICLTTTSKERVVKEDGHLAKWQKPLKLYDRIISPYLAPREYKSDILDLFMGVGTLAKWVDGKNWAGEENIDYIGLEKDSEVYLLALKNMFRIE